MIIQEILINIEKLKIYDAKEWEEFLSYFVLTNQIAERIKSGNGIAHNSQIIQSEKSITIKAFTELARGKIVGVMSGSYDLLHLAHIRTMAYARKILGNNILCVLLLSDENIKKKKGISRPILNINERIEMLNFVKYVDYVITLDEPNCINALDSIKPKYFFRQNYDFDQNTVGEQIAKIVQTEIEIVEKYGGQIVDLGLSNIPIRSTTDLVNFIKNNLSSDTTI